jgi:hypothetical protein
MDNLLLLTTIAASSLLGVGAGALVVKAMLALTGRMLEAGGVSSAADTPRQRRRRAA